jgi:hypothetical protein
VLALAILNRETSCFLVFVFLFSMWGEIRNRTLAGHPFGQTSLWIGVKYLPYIATGQDQMVFSTSRFGVTLCVLCNILAFQNNGVKDLIELIVCFGGVHWLAPWLLPGLPRFVRRSLLTVIPFICVAIVMHYVCEMRGYVELIPLVLTPVVYRVARPVHWSIKYEIIGHLFRNTHLTHFRSGKGNSYDVPGLALLGPIIPDSRIAGYLL